jgi:hypothetical protein
VNATGHLALGLDLPGVGGLLGREGLDVPLAVLVVIVDDPGLLPVAFHAALYPLPDRRHCRLAPCIWEIMIWGLGGLYQADIAAEQPCWERGAGAEVGDPKLEEE